MILWDVIDTIVFLLIVLSIGQLFAVLVFSKKFRNNARSILFKTFIIGLFGVPLLLFGYYNANYITQTMLESTIDGTISIQKPYFVRLDLLLYSGVGMIIALIVDWINRKMFVNRNTCNVDD